MDKKEALKQIKAGSGKLNRVFTKKIIRNTL